MLAATPGRRRHRRRLLALAATGVLAAGGGLVVWWISRSPAFHEPAGVSALVREIDRAVPASLRKHDVLGASVHGRAARPGWARQAGFPDRAVYRSTAGWRLHESEFDAREVTLRRLLSHTAGINVSGYPGQPPGSALPSTEASLAGASRAGEVRIVDAPGSEWRYSGGGYTLAQLAVERATGEPYARVVEREVLRSMGMARTGFDCTASEFPPRGAASGHDADGKPVPAYRFAEQGRAGSARPRSTWGASRQP